MRASAKKLETGGGSAAVPAASFRSVPLQSRHVVGFARQDTFPLSAFRFQHFSISVFQLLSSAFCFSPVFARHSGSLMRIFACFCRYGRDANYCVFAQICMNLREFALRRLLCFKAFLGDFRWTNAFYRVLTRINTSPCGTRISASLSPRAAACISAFQLFSICHHNPPLQI